MLYRNVLQPRGSKIASQQGFVNILSGHTVGNEDTEVKQ